MNLLPSLIALLLPSATLPLEGRTVIVLCQDAVEGQAAATCSSEATLVEWARAQGARLVDPVQVARVRAQLAPEQFSDPAQLKGVNLLDADLALLVQTRVTMQMAVGRMKSHLVQVTLRAVDVATGQLIHVDEWQGNVLALNAQAALPLAMTDWWRTRQGKVSMALAEATRAPPVGELWVYDIPDLQGVMRVEESLRRATGVSGVQRSHFGGGLARWRVTLATGTDPLVLAAALESGDSMLVAQGMTGSALQFAWKPGARARFPVVVRTTSDKSVPGWMARALPELVTGALRATPWADVRMTAGAGPEPLVAEASVGSGPKRFVINAQLRRGKKRLGSVTRPSTEADLAAGVQAALTQLLGDFERTVLGRPGDLVDLKRLMEATPLLGLEVAMLRGEDALHGALAERYRQQGIGRVRFSMQLDDVKVRSRLEGGSWVDAVTARGRDAVIPSPWTAEAARKLTQPVPTALEVEVSGSVGERRYLASTKHALVLYPPQSMRWSDPDAFAAFIAPVAPWTRAWLAAVPATTQGGPLPWLGRAVDVWNTLGRLGLHYIADPNAPFGASDIDSVQLGAATLDAGAGDCDDLTALVASLFEAAGISTRLVVLRHHVLLAVDTSLPATAWPLFHAAEGEALVENGRLLLPVDAIAVGRPFWEAVQRGSAAIRAERASARVVEPRAAWALYPPQDNTAAVQRMPGKSTRPRVLVMEFTGPEPLKNKLDVLGREVAQVLAGMDVEVTTRGELAELLGLREMQQLSGCEAAECLADLSRTTAARLMVLGRASHAGKGVVLQLSVLDTVDASSRGAVQLKAANLDELVGTLQDPVERMMQPVAASLGIGRLSTGWEAYAAAHSTRLGNDPYALARWHTLTGDLVAANDDAGRVPAGPRADLARANVAFAAGKTQDAAVAWTRMDSDGARLNRGLACVALGRQPDADLVSSMAIAPWQGRVGASVPLATMAGPTSGAAGMEAVRDGLERVAKGDAPKDPASADALRFFVQW